MARMRTIKPEFWVDDKVVDLDILAKLLYIGLWNFADDDGYIEDSARRVKRQIFPDNDYDVATAIDALVASGMVTRNVSDQGPILHITKFKDHQKPQHPTATKFTNIRVGATRPQPVSSTPHEDERKAHEPSPSSGEESSGDESRNVAEIRPDVSRLCNLLAELIEGNGSKRPEIGKSWHDAARLMLDKDKRPLAEVVGLVQWSQQDSFWRANILSMPTFRDKYDQLRLQREAKAKEAPPAAPKKRFTAHAD